MPGGVTHPLEVQTAEVGSDFSSLPIRGAVPMPNKPRKVTAHRESGRQLSKPAPFTVWAPTYPDIFGTWRKLPPYYSIASFRCSQFRYRTYSWCYPLSITCAGPDPATANLVANGREHCGHDPALRAYLCSLSPAGVLHTWFLPHSLGPTAASVACRASMLQLM